MNGFSLFHTLAAERGDGLLPELQRIFEPADQNVVELAAFRAPVIVHAGPAPKLRGELPANVLAFAPRVATPKPDTEKPRRPRVSRARKLNRAKA